MRNARGLAVGITLWSAVACAPAANEAPPAPETRAKPIPVLVEAGARDYRELCASCHGPEGQGDGSVAPLLRTPPPDLTRIAARRGGRFPAADLRDWIDGRFIPSAHGTREMPVWGLVLGEGYPEGELEEEAVRGRIEALLAYLEAIQRP